MSMWMPWCMREDQSCPVGATWMPCYMRRIYDWNGVVPTIDIYIRNYFLSAWMLPINAMMPEKRRSLVLRCPSLLFRHELTFSLWDIDAIWPQGADILPPSSTCFEERWKSWTRKLISPPPPTGLGERCSETLTNLGHAVLFTPMWTPPINESAELTQGGPLINLLRWAYSASGDFQIGMVVSTTDIYTCTYFLSACMSTWMPWCLRGGPVWYCGRCVVPAHTLYSVKVVLEADATVVGISVKC